MGWNTANEIFNPVARALIDCNAPDEMKTRVLGELIGQLQGEDWDTEDESLDEFKHDPAIVAAFRARGVYVHCEAEAEDGSLDCDLEIGHDGDHRDWQGKTWRPAAVDGELLGGAS